MTGCVVLLSGGIDSTVLLHHAKASHVVLTLSVWYGQRHWQMESECAEFQCKKLGIERVVIRLPAFAGSALTDEKKQLPLDVDYAAPEQFDTVVPNRNMVMLSLAASLALSRKATTIAYGPHSGDRAIYYDCRPEFIDAAARVFEICDRLPITLWTPFSKWSRAMIIQRGTELGVDFHRTWSCYSGGEKHCGRCGACIERKEAFLVAKIYDPTEYET